MKVRLAFPWQFGMSILFCCAVFLSDSLLAQGYASPVRQINYQEILSANMVPIANIERMKISATGAKIVFNTVGGELYTINTDGTSLIRLMDQNGRGFIDISDDGSTVIFAPMFAYEIKVFNSQGGQSRVIANNLPLPNGGVTGPDIRLSPVIADSCGLSGLEKRVFFTAVAGGPDVAGVWSVKLDGSDLQQHVRYRYMAQMFGYDGNEYNGNIAFRQGLGVAEQGNAFVYTTFSFQPEGHTMYWNESNGLEILRDFGAVDGGIRPYAISSDGNRIIMCKRIDGVVGAEVISIDLPGNTTTTLIEHIGTSSLVQIAAGNGLLLAKGDGICLKLLAPDDQWQLDIVNSPSLVSSGNPFYRNCIGETVSVSANGQRFAFVSALHYNDFTRIWVSDIDDWAGGGPPTIGNIQLDPNFVTVNGGSVATFSAEIGGGTIVNCGFSGFNDGVYEHIIGNGNAYLLWDDGTHGDPQAGDGVYTGENVFTNMQENPDPGHAYTIRFSAATEHSVTVVDVMPFFIYNLLGTDEREPDVPMAFQLFQNYPNPFNPDTKIEYTLPSASVVTLSVYDLLGQRIRVLVDIHQPAGEYSAIWDGRDYRGQMVSSGIYFYHLEAGNLSTGSGQGFVQSRKMVLMQ